MKLLASLLIVLLASSGIAFAEAHSHAPGKPRRAELVKGLGSHHHPIATTSPEAQKFFDQGLVYVFGFNHDEAILAFERAHELDPKAVMPLWGIAYALGPNYNLPVDWEREKAANAKVKEAAALAARDGVPENERAYVVALARRYTDDEKANLKALDVEFSEAMKRLWRKNPDDLDAATLYAESLMDLRPWQLWNADGTPAEDTTEILTTLETVLARDPNHPGANHYYVHATEGSPNPERALPSAARLKTLVPAAGHLVHMPSHVYMRTGDFAAAAEANAVAAKVDEAYLARTKAAGVYPMMYYTHNVHFLAAARAMEGRYADAREAAAKTAKLAAPIVAEMPMVEFFLPVDLFVELRFAKWKTVLALPEPRTAPPATKALWHYGRGVALAATGKVKEARSERADLASFRAAMPDDSPWNLNKGTDIVDLAAHVLDGRLAEAEGKPEDGVDAYRKATLIQDKLIYDEPPSWYYPVRESLGGALLRAGKHSQAEAVFREDLARNPRNPRSLFGLWKTLEAAGRSIDARWVKRELDAAWKTADSKLRVEDL